MSHGRQDDIISIEQCSKTAAGRIPARFDVSGEMMGHTIDGDCMADLKTWLGAVCPLSVITRLDIVMHRFYCSVDFVTLS